MFVVVHHFDSGGMSAAVPGEQTFYVSGEVIRFPYTPYPAQKVLISKALSAIQQSKNALLESPTGTGKSLAILSAVLAWRERNTTEKPKIIFASRTHSQLGQLVSELRKSPHHKDFSAVCIGSKKQYCVHPTISKAPNRDHLCKVAIKKHNCSYYPNTEKFTQKIVSQGKTILDVEELSSSASHAHACPYFTAKQLLPNSDIIFCPYNYILDFGIRQRMGIDLTDTIIILDEAHNVDDVCRDSAGLTIEYKLLDETKQEFDALLLSNESSTFFQWSKLINELLIWTTRSIENFAPNSEMKSFKQQTQYWSVKKTQEILKAVGFTEARKKELTAEMISIKKLYEEQELDEIITIQNIPQCISTKSLQVIQELLVLLQLYLKPNASEDFHLILQSNSNKRNEGLESHFSIALWCMSPKVAFQELSVARSIIVMSGTLSPKASFGQELNTNFHFQLETQHIVPTQNTWIQCVGRSTGNVEVKATYENVSSLLFQDAIGDILLEYFSIIPGGVLVFLPSYHLVRTLVERWKVSGKWAAMKRKKNMLLEPNCADDLPGILSMYYSSIENGKGAVLFAVCRGKVSEGINFADDYARAVIVIGIPFPSIKEPSIMLKKAYNTKYTASKGILNGNAWYSQQAFRALNQALGRCIRHKDDYGSIIMIDSRFEQQETKNQLSKWIRRRIIPPMPRKDSLERMKKFYESFESIATPKKLIKKKMSPPRSLKPKPNRRTSLHLSGDIARMYQQQKSQELPKSSSQPLAMTKLPRGNSQARTRIPSLDMATVLPTSPLKQEKMEEISKVMVEYIVCNSCEGTMASQSQITTKSEIHWDGQLLGAWMLSKGASPSICEDSTPFVWVVEDGCVYQKVSCSFCPRSDLPHPIGLKIIATIPEKNHLQNRILLFFSRCSKQSIETQKRKFLDSSFSSFSKKMKIEL